MPVEMGGWGFNIQLFPAYKERVVGSLVTAEQVRGYVERQAEQWLDSCGYDQPFTCGGKVQRLYGASSIQVSWGEWGPEHITVPGNACGLDIHRYYSSRAPQGGKLLVSHNVDTMQQATLLLIVFTSISDIVSSLYDTNTEEVRSHAEKTTGVEGEGI